MPRLIALIGPAGSGKTTLADQLVLRLGFAKKPFAAYIKDMLRTFLEDQGLDTYTINQMLFGDLKEVDSPFLSGRSPRYAMQTLGTEWRELMHRDLWVNAWTRDVVSTLNRVDINVVADDMRFLHEAECVVSLGGKIVRVERPGFTFDKAHRSEFEYLDIKPDVCVENTGSPGELFNALISVLPPEL